jgi:cytochrome b pre-mRNA-processing protein 3
MFRFIKNRQIVQEKAVLYYKAAETQARQPVFYEDFNVPDTPYGRFDMITLHCFLLVRRLNEVGEGNVAQKVFDVMFKTLDMAMREMAISDLAVPKKMKKFMKDFNGRATRYQQALEAGDDNVLKEAVRRNIYGTADDVCDSDLQNMVDYIKANADLSAEGLEFITPEKKKAA